MLTPEQILLLVTATGNAVEIFDKISGQIVSVLLKRAKESEGGDERWRYKVRGEGDKFVVRQDKQVIQTITADDLAKLPADQLSLITTYQNKMEQNYKLWQAVYDSKDSSPDPLVNAKVDQQLVGLVDQMKRDLTNIIDFLQKLGLHLDDHYMQVRGLVDNV